MKSRYPFILLALCVLGSGCSEKINPDSGALVHLSASVSDALTLTKTAVTAVPYNETVPGPYSATPSENKALDAAVWFTNTVSHTYSVGAGVTYPRQSTIRFTSAGAAFPVDALEYPSNNSTIYCVGLYPATGWTSTESDTKATHAIDGSEDLMMAPEIAGSLNTHFGTLAFTHELTWLKIYVNAATQAIDAWGNLTKITVTSPGSTLTADFTTDPSSTSCDTTPLDIIAFDGSQALTVTDQLRGSIFCAPAAAYTIKVETANYNTSNGMAVTLSNVPLIDGNGDSIIASYAKGKMFIITLNLKEIHEIEAAVTLGNMESGSETITLK